MFKYIIFILLIQNFCKLSDQKKLALKFDRFEICQHSPKSSFVWKYIRIANYTKQYGNLFDAEIVAIRDVNDLHLTLDIKRCKNKEARDTCEPITALRPRGGCNFIAAKNTAWEPYFYNYQPHHICPYKKNTTYVGKGLYFKADLFNLFPIAGYYFSLKISFYEKKLLSYTMCVEFLVAEIR